VIVTNGTVMPIVPDKDLTITATANAANTTTSNATFYVDVVYGPSGGQRTTVQPISGTLTLTGTTNATKSFFFSRTNFYGASGVVASGFSTTALTNATLVELSGNFWP